MSEVGKAFSDLCEDVKKGRPKHKHKTPRVNCQMCRYEAMLSGDDPTMAFLYDRQCHEGFGAVVSVIKALAESIGTPRTAAQRTALEQYGIWREKYCD